MSPASPRSELTRCRFLYGFPPFHDETPEKVFENILSRRIEWHEDEVDISDEARDFMERLLCSDATRRLGANGSDEIKAHPFLADIEWDNLLAGQVDFVPKISDPESTDYFDPRGATAQVFDTADVVEGSGTGDAPLVHRTQSAPPQRPTAAELRRAPRERSETAPLPSEDFGTFNFRNLPVLKQANDEVIRKLRDEQMRAVSVGPDQLTPAFARSPVGRTKARAQSLEFRVCSRLTWASADVRQTTGLFSSSPSGMGSAAGSSSSGSTHHSRPPSDPSTPSETRGAELVSRTRQLSISSTASPQSRRNSMPSRIRTASMSELERPPLPENWTRRRSSAQVNVLPTPSERPSPLSLATRLPLATTPSISPVNATQDRVRTIDCLVAGKNPITNKVLETMLVRLGCRCVVVPDGGEAILAANSVQFDIIWMDLQMAPISGEKAARYIKSTRSASALSAIVAVCSYGTAVDDDVGTLFSAVLPKPIAKDQVLAVLRKLGFTEKSKTDGSVFRRGSEAELLDPASRRVSADDGAEVRRGSS